MGIRKLELVLDDVKDMRSISVMDSVTEIDRYLIVYMNKLLKCSATLQELEKCAKISDIIAKKYKVSSISSSNVSYESGEDDDLKSFTEED